MNLLIVYATVVFVPMLLEALLSRRNEQALRSRGAIEPPGDVYRLMLIAYPAAFLLMLLEGGYRDPHIDVVVTAGFTIFVAAKLLKYWAVTTLGERWTYRVLVLPDVPLVASGPYRLLRHPNYLAVVGELVGAALLVHAFVTGPVAVLGFGALMLARIRVEERALGLRSS
ncbi:MAG TPA: isoprenylcysteine carboxylmethyltransferase family protein [Vicinamibacterales bacterium]|nr:isoprenylcysteine carboxylmethyltransferase family protein [Vicinamibacterales bacterium]